MTSSVFVIAVKLYFQLTLMKRDNFTWICVWKRSLNIANPRTSIFFDKIQDNSMFMTDDKVIWGDNSGTNQLLIFNNAKVGGARHKIYDAKHRHATPLKIIRPYWMCAAVRSYMVEYLRQNICTSEGACWLAPFIHNQVHWIIDAPHHTQKRQNLHFTTILGSSHPWGLEAALIMIKGKQNQYK